MNNMVENSCPIPVERERELIEIFRAGGEPAREAAGELIVSQSKWIMSIISQMKAPKWVDPDVIFADIMPVIFDSLNDYDPSRNLRLTTFISTVTKRASNRAIKKYLSQSRRETATVEEIGKTSPAESRVVDTEELFDIIKDLLESNSLSRKSRLIIDRLIRERSKEDICQQLKMSPKELTKSIRHIQEYIAIHLLQNNAPCEGILPSEVIERAKRSMTRCSIFDVRGLQSE